MKKHTKFQLHFNGFLLIISLAMLCIIIISIPIIKYLNFTKLSAISYSLDLKSDESNSENDIEKKNETTEFLSQQTLFIKRIKIIQRQTIYHFNTSKILSRNLEIVNPPPKI